MIISLKEVKEYARIDIDEDDQLLETLITAAEEYLKNATAKSTPKQTKTVTRSTMNLKKFTCNY